jgi:hypothetical protein
MVEKLSIAEQAARIAEEWIFGPEWTLEAPMGTSTAVANLNLRKRQNAVAREIAATIRERLGSVADPLCAGWQAIATAPKDGRKVDLWHPTKGRLVDVFWHKQTSSTQLVPGWGTASLGRIVGATHWRPLPEPPKEVAR